ncbi:DUF3617 domain-containing protein [Sphingomonadaceae bacterium]|nr:DUF3617 domain-containing protein [Sphingomonadaceae bacterium]
MTTSAMGQEVVTKMCITEEMAASPDGGLGSDVPEGCTGDGISIDGGKITGSLTCNQGGQETVLTFDGNVSGDEYNMATAMEVAGNKIESAMVGKRVGDCPA